MGMFGDLETAVRVLSFLPIVLCSIVGLAMTLAKWAQLRRAMRGGSLCLSRVAPLVRERDYERAQSLLQDDRSAAVELILAGLQREERPASSLLSDIEWAGRRIVRRLEYGLGGIALIATLGPLFGLLGTVVGIAVVFDRLAAVQGIATPGELAGGIGTALYTTIAGLVVGICALVSHRWLATLVDTATVQLEGVGRELASLLGPEAP